MEKQLQQSKMEQQQLLVEYQKQQAKTAQVQDMFDDGVIKQDEGGNYVPVLDPNEKAYIREQTSASK